MSVIRRALKLLASVAVVVMVAAAAAIGSSNVRSVREPAVRLSPPRVTPTGALINATGLREGETRSAQFSVRNVNSVTTGFYVRGRLTSGNSELYDALTASLHSAATGTPIWSGRLRDLDTGREAGEIGGGNFRRYTIAVGVPAWAGDNLQALRSEFDLDFSFTLRGAPNDTTPPISYISLRRSTRVRTRSRFPKPIRLSFQGGAKDDQSDIARVEMSLVRYSRPVKKRKGAVGAKKRICRRWVPVRRSFIGRTRGRCIRFWITTKGADPWRYRFARHRLRPGRYEIRVRAIDAAGNIEKSSRRRGKNINVLRFRVKRAKPVTVQPAEPVQRKKR